LALKAGETRQLSRICMASRHKIDGYIAVLQRCRSANVCLPTVQLSEVRLLSCPTIIVSSSSLFTQRSLRLCCPCSLH